MMDRNEFRSSVQVIVDNTDAIFNDVSKLMDVVESMGSGPLTRQWNELYALHTQLALVTRTARLAIDRTDNYEERPI